MFLFVEIEKCINITIRNIGGKKDEEKKTGTRNDLSWYFSRGGEVLTQTVFAEDSSQTDTIQSNSGVQASSTTITTENGLVFDPDTNTITGYDFNKVGWRGSVTIPSEINGIKVLKIGKSALDISYVGAEGMIPKVIVSEGITHIEQGALANIYISLLKLPNSLTILEEDVISGNRIENLVIPKNVTEIKSNFMGYGFSDFITISDKVKTIGDNAFTMFSETCDVLVMTDDLEKLDIKNSEINKIDTQSTTGGMGQDQKTQINWYRGIIHDTISLRQNQIDFIMLKQNEYNLFDYFKCWDIYTGDTGNTLYTGTDIQIPEQYLPDIQFELVGTPTSKETKIDNHNLVVGADENNKNLKVKATLGSSVEEIPLCFIKATNSWTKPLSIADWSYNENPSNPIATAKYGEVYYTYSQTENGEYTREVPKLAGTWYVKANVDTTDSYEGITSEVKKFEIKKSQNQWASELTIDGWLYNESANTPFAVAKFDNATVIYQYSQTSDGTYTPSIPTEVGTWYVKAYAEETANCLATESQPLKFEIGRAFNDWSKKLALQDWTYKDNTNTPQATAKYEDATISYKYSQTKDGTYTSKVPTQAGIWYVKAYTSETTHYQVTESDPVEFKILKAKNDWLKELSIQNWLYNETAKTPEATVKYEDATISYKYSQTKDGTYTSKVPTQAGTWYVKAFADSTNNYQSLESQPVLFQIGQATNQWIEELSIQDWTYGSASKNPKTKSLFGDVIYTYSSQKDGAYTIKVPQNAGTYYVKASVEETTNYSQLEAIQEFKIFNPEILVGENIMYTSGIDQELVFKCSGLLEDLTKVIVDGNVISQDNYKLESGSTILTLTKDYLDTLSNGKHTLTMCYGTTNVDIPFVVKNDSKPIIVNGNQKTGDMNSLEVFSVAFIVSVIGISIFRKKEII